MRLILMCLALPLAACQDEPTPAPTAEESARLDEAGAMLDNEAAARPDR
ncbi:MAG: hypothetical protein M3R03_06710 [Pseudomonadota bacterium]|nr:hypothetical protein [Pseudomonadota bacterium]